MEQAKKKEMIKIMSKSKELSVFDLDEIINYLVDGFLFDLDADQSEAMKNLVQIKD